MINSKLIGLPSCILDNIAAAKDAKNRIHERLGHRPANKRSLKCALPAVMARRFVTNCAKVIVALNDHPRPRFGAALESLYPRSPCDLRNARMFIFVFSTVPFMVSKDKKDLVSLCRRIELLFKVILPTVHEKINLSQM